MSDRHNHMGVDDEIRVIQNFLDMMPNTYRKRHSNWVVVRDIILYRTFTGGCTSCMEECRRIGIDPDGHTLDRVTGAGNGEKEG